MGLQIFHNLIHIGRGLGIAGLQGGQLVLLPPEEAGEALLPPRVEVLELADQVGQGVANLPPGPGADLLEGVLGELRHVFFWAAAPYWSTTLLSVMSMVLAKASTALRWAGVSLASSRSVSGTPSWGGAGGPLGALAPLGGAAWAWPPRGSWG